MNDFEKKITILLEYFSTYFKSYFSLLHAPYEFFKSFDFGSDKVLSNALFFYVLSSALYFSFRLLSVDSIQLWLKLFVVKVVFDFMTLVVFAFFIYLAFKILKIKANFQDYVITMLYCTPIILLPVVFGTIASSSLILHYQPDLFPIFKDSLTIRIGPEVEEFRRMVPSLMSNYYYALANYILVAFLVVSLIWSLFLFKTYAMIGNSTRAKAVSAFFLSAIPIITLTFSLSFVRSALDINWV